MPIRNLLNNFIIFFLIIFLNINNTQVQALTSESKLINIDAPSFNLEGYNPTKPEKNTWDLDYFKHSWLILYFYPKDLTPGCTIEAKGFQRLIRSYNQLDASIVGVSDDSISNHKDFCDSTSLNYTLLSDKDGLISKSYNSWQNNHSMRNTFLIDPSGKIIYSWRNVNPSKNPSDVLNLLTELETS